MKKFIDGEPVIAAAGMDFEARIAEGPGTTVVFGQKRDRYLQQLHALAREGARGIISFGTAGGVSPYLKPGDVIVATSVITAKEPFPTHSKWSDLLRKKLPHAHTLPVFGAEKPVLTVLEKEALWSATGVGAVDMESRPAAEVAAHYGLPYAVLRVVIDPADRAIPLSAIAGVREDGTTDVTGVMRSLIRRPGDVGDIVRLAGDSRKANKALLGSRKALGPFFGLLDLLELPLNVE